MAFYVSEIKRGAPERFVNEVQKMIYDSLDAMKIEYTRVESDPGISMDDCKNIDRAFGVDTVKTILLTNRQKNRYWLYITHADKPFVTKDFGAALQIPRVSFADEELMMNLLGTKHGAATPLGLVKDKDKIINFIIDKDVSERDRLVVTDGDPCGFINIAVADIYKVAGREPIVI